MVYTGYLEFGGREVINGGRTSAYVAASLPSLQLQGCTDCEDLNLALGHKAYTSPLVDQPAWFDADNPDTWDFYGLYPLSFEGFEDATTDATVTQYNQDGGAVSRPRRATRSMRVTGLLIGLTPAAVSAGMTWLRQVLRPSACRSGSDCTGDHLCYFVACPPLCEDAPELAAPTHHPDGYRECETGIVIAGLGQCTFPYERHLYQSTVIAGPTITEEFDPTCGAMVKVEFTIVSGVPSPFGTAVHVSTGPSGTLVSIPNETCAADAGGELLLRTNLAPNPAPADPAGWGTADPTHITVTRDGPARRGGVATVKATRTVANTPVVQSVSTNLATNPSMETSTTTVATRINWATHPNGTAYLSGTLTTLGWNNSRWFGSVGAGTYTSLTGVTDGPLPGITAYARKTWTTAQTTAGGAGDTGIQTNDWSSFVAGATYTVSAYMRSSIARTLSGFDVQFRDATGLFQRNSFSQSNLAAGVWQRFSAVVTTPVTGATAMTIILDTDGPETIAAGTTLDVTGLLVEQVGTPGALQRTNLHPNPALGRNNNGWNPASAGGTFTITRETSMGATTGSLPFGASMPWYKITNTVTNTSSPWGVYTNASGTSGIPVVAGQSYQFAAYHVSSLNASATVRLSWTWFDAAGASVGTAGASTLVANTPNTWQRLTSTAQVAPAGAAFVMLAVFQSGTGIAVGSFMGVTGAQVEQTTSMGQYFDGSTIAVGSTQEYTWSGTPMNSTSLQRAPSTGWLRDFFDGATRPWLRVNMAPSPALDATGLITGVSNLSAQTAGTAGQVPFTGSTFRRLTAGATPAVGDGFDTSGSVTQAPVVRVAGPHTFSVWVRSSHLVTMRPTIIHSGATSAVITASPDVVLQPGVWTRTWVTATFAAVGPVGFRLRNITGGGTIPTGGTLDVGGFLFEPGTSTTSTYFDGTTAQPAGFTAAWGGTANLSPSYIYDADLTASWSGTANASTSLLTGQLVAGANSSTARPAIRSTRWAATGTYSLRQIPSVVGTSDTYASPQGDTGAMRGGMVAGKTYTAAARIWLPAAQTGSLSGQARRIVAYWRAGAGSYVTRLSLPAENAAGATDLQLTFTLPADTTEAFVRLYNGAAAGNGDAWWDNFMLVEGTSIPGGQYWDGSTTDSLPPAQHIVYDWTGTANASTSTRTVYQTETAIASLTNIGAYGTTAATQPVLTAGLTHLVSLYVMPQISASITMTVQPINDAGAAVGPVFTSPFVVVNAMTWQRVTVQLTTPAGATRAVVSVSATGFDGAAGVGAWFATGDLLVEAAYGAPLAYFDGDTDWGEEDIETAWVGTPSRSSSTMTRVVAVVGPILDPDCPPVPAPPRPPVIESTCVDDPDTYLRYVAQVPADAVPVWSDAVPIIRIYSGPEAVRQLRLRFYDNAFEVDAGLLDPCVFCGEFIVSYLPANSLLTIDGITQTATVSQGAAASQPASHLLYGTGGGPMVWPHLTCGIRYDMTVDIVPDITDLRIDLCVAGRE